MNLSSIWCIAYVINPNPNPNPNPSPSPSDNPNPNPNPNARLYVPIWPLSDPYVSICPAHALHTPWARPAPDAFHYEHALHMLYVPCTLCLPQLFLFIHVFFFVIMIFSLFISINYFSYFYFFITCMFYWLYWLCWGGSYKLLANTTTKHMAALAACMTNHLLPRHGCGNPNSNPNPDPIPDSNSNLNI
jgi:hypothetical protein